MGDVRRFPWPQVGLALGLASLGCYARPGYCLLCAVSAFFVSLLALRRTAKGEPWRWMAVAGVGLSLLGFLWFGCVAYLIYSVASID